MYVLKFKHVSSTGLTGIMHTIKIKHAWKCFKVRISKFFRLFRVKQNQTKQHTHTKT